MKRTSAATASDHAAWVARADDHRAALTGAHAHVHPRVTLRSDLPHCWFPIPAARRRIPLYVANSGTLVRVDAPAATARTDSKLVQLEALRGLAAFIVVAWHFLWAFDPARIGIVDGSIHPPRCLAA